MYREPGRRGAALAAFRGGDLGVARREFAALAAASPGDPVAAIHEQRLAALGDVVPAGWTAFLTASDWQRARDPRAVLARRVPATTCRDL